MERARISALVAAAVTLVLGTGVLAGGTTGTPDPARVPLAAATVAWPPSTVVISEVQTDGPSASDEFVEVANQGFEPVDLGGLEVAYVTATGGTITRKATWVSPAILDPGRRVLVANSLGGYAGIADATYSGGFAATGGALVLRPIGGAPIDAVGWGDATNAFVEGSAAEAPPAGSSIERRPGGIAGNATDTNENALDFFVTAPSPQGTAAPPVPAPGVTPEPTPVPTPGPDPEPTATPTPTGTPTPEPTPPPTPSPTPTPSPEPTTVPTPSPSPVPTPNPTTTPSPTPATTPSPAPTPPSPSPSPSPTSSPAPAILSIGAARALPAGSTVTTTGIVTVEAGRLGSPAQIAIGDETGAGIVVRVPDGETAPSRGLRVVVRGKLADPYGQLEIRPAAESLSVIGTAGVPPAVGIEAADLGERTEGGLVVIEGTVAAAAARSTSGDLTIPFEDPTGSRFRVLVDASAGIERSHFVVGMRYWLTGIVGQRATRKGALDGYRIWVRDIADVVELGRDASDGAGAGGGGDGGSAVPPLSIAVALRQGEGAARVEGVVTIAATLLDSTGRRIVIQDASAAIEILLPGSTIAPAVGSRILVNGELGRAYGAPRLRAETVTRLGSGPLPAPWPVTGAPGPAQEWRLAVASGTIVDVTRLGDRWRADLLVGPARIAIVGQAGSGIPSTALVEGRRATIVGIVRRPYPTATDRRFAVVPRSSSDVRLGPAEPGAGGSGASSSGSSATRGMAGSRAGSSGPKADDVASPRDVDLGELADHEGSVVRVGGLVVRVLGTVVDLDDGSAEAAIHLLGEAAPLAALLGPGDPINAIGSVVRLEDGTLAVSVDDAGAVFRIGALGQPMSLGPGRHDGGPGASADDGQLADDPGGHRDAGLDLVPDPATGLAGVVIVALLSVLVTLVRQAMERRRLATQVRARVALFAGVGGVAGDTRRGGSRDAVRSPADG